MRTLIRRSWWVVALLPLGACARHEASSSTARSATGPAAPTASVSAGSDSCTEDGAVEVLHHTIDLSLRLDPPSLSGRGELRLRSRRATAMIRLDTQSLNVTEAAGASGPLPFRRMGEHLCVELPRPLPESSELTLKIAWEVPTRGKVPHFSGDEVWAGYTTSAWMPTVQDPAQRATLALRIAAPAHLKVAGSGRNAEQAPARDGLRTHSFVLERPSPPFLFAFAIGRFEEEAELSVEGVKLRAFGPAGSDLKGVLAATAAMVSFLKARTGAALPSPEYIQVFVSGDAAQEAAGLALLSTDALDDLRKDPTDDWILSHELSHQWFGWLVPCADFADFWLNEGFATFLAAAYKETRWGRQAYERELGVWRSRSAKVHAQGRDAPLSLSAPGALPQKAPRESELQPRGVTYYRGALVLHKLRSELGDAAFWAGIQHYVKDRAGKSARTEDLRVSLEAASGQDLRGFFAKWVYSAAPDL